MKILVGYAGSECSYSALDDLTRAGLPERADVLMLGVADMWPILPNPEDEKFEHALTPETAQAWEAQLEAAEHGNLPEAVQKAHEYALKQMAELRTAMSPGIARVKELFPLWKVNAEAVADSPYWALVKRAESWKADLLFVGSHGRSALGRLLLGSVSQNVVNHARCSVRIAHCHHEERQSGPVRLVVGIDGSTDSSLAAATIASRQWPQGTSALVLGVVEEKHATFFASSAQHHHHAEAAASHELWLRNACEAAGARIASAGVRVELREAHGDPRQLLISEAESWNADSIFVGALGHRRAGPSMLGPVASTVAARAHCSVEIVRASP